MARASDPIQARLAATHIVRTLRNHGHIAYFAGGSVRDALLGQHPTDYDVATDAPPRRVRQIFPRSAEVGAAFGVVLVHVAPHDLDPAPPTRSPHAGSLVSVEVATFRSDGPYSDARRPDTVTFSDPKSDAERRDFTINALFLDPLAPPDPGTPQEAHGRIIDFVGGAADLSARILRAVGDPARRLAEDHLRALRAVRFAARLNFQIEPGTAAAIRSSAAELRGVSRERIGEELRRMLVHPSRARAVDLLETLTLDAPVLNEPPRASARQLVGGLPEHAAFTTVLAAWTLDRLRATGNSTSPQWLSDQETPSALTRLRSALTLSNDETEELLAVLQTIWMITQRWGIMRTAQQKRTASRTTFGQSLDVVRASDSLVATRVRDDVVRLASDGIGINPPVLVTGDDLIGGGFKPGPRFKSLLDEIRDTQLEGGIRTKQEGMELARTLSVKP